MRRSNVVGNPEAQAIALMAMTDFSPIISVSVLEELGMYAGLRCKVSAASIEYQDVDASLISTDARRIDYCKRWCAEYASVKGYTTGNACCAVKCAPRVPARPAARRAHPKINPPPRPHRSFHENNDGTSKMCEVSAADDLRLKWRYVSSSMRWGFMYMGVNTPAEAFSPEEAFSPAYFGPPIIRQGLEGFGIYAGLRCQASAASIASGDVDESLLSTNARRADYCKRWCAEYASDNGYTTGNACCAVKCAPRVPARPAARRAHPQMNPPRDHTAAFLRTTTAPRGCARSLPPTTFG